MTNLQELALNARVWPFEEARRIVKRIGGKTPEKGYVLFETGYGPSGLPHLGTFGEVMRATMVRRAFELMAPGIPTRLFCFSDDLDGLRKVPGNVPNQELLKANLDKPLTQVPDPFEKFPSFGEHNNAMLRDFLDRFGFEYEFQSATERYKSGVFNPMLLRVLERFDAIMAIMIPSLGGVNEERLDTYSPFMPISPKTGKVLQTKTLERNLSKGTIVYAEPDGEKVEISVLDGNCKLQWKPDFGMRWAALGVDYEMSGKDLIASVELATEICQALGETPPETYIYEHFLDEEGKKISKSKGNGLTMEQWLTYASPESLGYYMFQKPRTAKRLYFSVIPKAVDEYHQQLGAFERQDEAARLENPVWHVHQGNPPQSDLPITFAMLQNLAIASGAEDASKMWGFIRRYVPGASPETHPGLDAAAAQAARFATDQVKRNYRLPTERERAAFADLALQLRNAPVEADAKALQDIAYEVGKAHGFENLRDWFKALYEVLLGQEEGPRFGGFAALYGVEATATLIDEALAKGAAQA
ncbi:lysine--tRNA ligase [Neomegalonema perideroedes]|uniref:lysine--tRNA ligase n=1 Tax=Neomegalonema perideroedes TaxID=217219 RepID=UPI000373CEE9|nr:lysine--tRNA ligase [Neomegalonema perideroedes]